MKNILSKIFTSTIILSATLLLSCQEDVRELRDRDPWIVYGSSRNDKVDIYAINPITKEKVFLAETISSEIVVRYDPYEDRIIFTRYDADGKVKLTDGKNNLFEFSNNQILPSWSIKGKIAYTKETESGEDIFIASSDRSNEKQVTKSPEIEKFPTYNSFGDKIVYVKQIESGWDLFMLDIETKEERRLTKLEKYVGHPSWSCDGKKIAFDTIYDGQSEIAVLNLESGKITRITHRTGDDLMPNWAPDSFTIAFSGDTDNNGNFDIWTVDIETKELRKWTDNPGYDGGAIFAPYSSIKEIIN